MTTEAIATHSAKRRPFIRELFLKWGTLLAAIVLVIIVLATVFASVLAPFDPLANDLKNSLVGPSLEHWLGTDQLGRDVLSRLLYGGQPALLASVQVTAVAILIGAPLGVVSGFMGGTVDQAIMRGADLIMALPVMVITLVVLAVFSDRLQFAFFAMGLMLVAPVARNLRSSAISTRGELFIDAAVVSGVSPLTVVFRHIVPRVAGPIMVQLTLVAAMSLLFTAGLAFLGFGIEPPNASWGFMVREATTVLRQNPWPLIASGGILGITILCLGILGDSIRDTAVERWSGGMKATKARVASVARPLTSATMLPDLDSLLAVQELEVSFMRNDVESAVVKKVSFSIGRGEVVGLVGESGCGKTTVSRAILGLLRGSGRISGGDILFEGRLLSEYSPAELRRLRGTGIAYVSQEPMVALDPTVRVGTTVMNSIRKHTGVGKEQARLKMLELFALVKLQNPEQVAGLFPHQISGGMAQRVSIARALSGGPRLLIADEPTTALDVTVQAEILDLIAELTRVTGMSVLLVTHDWGVVADLCDRAIVMYDGKIVEQAKVDDLFHAPQHEYTKKLLSYALELTRDDEPAASALVASALIASERGEGA